MIDIRNPNTLGEVPLLCPVYDDGLAVLRSNALAEFFSFDAFALEDDLAIEFQVADISSIILVYMVEILCVSEPTVERKVARDLLLDNQIDQISEQNVVVLKQNVAFFTSFTLNEPTEIDRVVLATGADIIPNQVVVSDLVTFIGVIPEISYVFNAFPVMINQDIVQGDDTLIAISSGRIALKPLQPLPVQLRDIPIHLGQPAVEARLVRRSRELTVDLRDVLMFGYEQTGQVLAKVSSRWLVRELVTKLFERLFDDGGKFDDRMTEVMWWTGR